jgi:hypothetical protein
MHPAASKEKGRPYLVVSGHRRRAPHTARCSESPPPRDERERWGAEREVNGRKKRQRREVVNTPGGERGLLYIDFCKPKSFHP